MRALVERFFAAYAKEDLDGFMALWSNRSPDYAMRRQVMPTLFARGDYTFSHLTVVSAQVEGEKARLRVTVDLTEITGERCSQRKLVRIFQLVKEEGDWKVWRYYPAAEDLAAALVAAHGTDEQEQLLAKEKELVGPELVECLLTLGDRQLEQENPLQALAAYRLTQRIAQQVDDRQNVAVALHRVGDAHWFMGQFKEAVNAYEASVAMLQECVQHLRERNAPEEAREALRLLVGALWQSGTFYKDVLGDQRRALAMYEKMLAVGRELGDRRIEAAALNCVGGCHVSLGELTQGIREIEEAVRLYESLLQQQPEPTLQREYLVTLNHLAANYSALLLYQDALARYEKSLKVSRAIGDKVGEMGALWGIGTVYGRQEDYEKAKTYFEQSLRLARAANHYGWIVTNTGGLMGIHLLLGEDDQALAYAEEALKASRQAHSLSWEAGFLGEIVSIYLRRGEWAKAQAYAEEARKKLESFGIATEESYALLGHIHYAQKQWQQAAEAYQKALVWEEQRVQWAIDPVTRAGLVGATASELYYRLAASLLALNRREEAVQVAERAKAQVLVTILREGKVDITKAMTEEEKRQEQALNEKIMQANAALRALQTRRVVDFARVKEVQAQLQAARQEYDTFRRSLYLKHPHLMTYRGERAPLSAPEIVQWLREQGALKAVVLNYLVGEERTLLFALNGQGQVAVYFVELPRKELERRVKALWDAVRQKEEGRLGALSRMEASLRRLDGLLAVALPMLKRATHFILIPDDVLWEVPFAALKPDGQHYLVEMGAISYAPSVTALKAIREHREGRKVPQQPLLAMAPFAVVERTNALRRMPLRGVFGPLPASRKEAHAIASLWGVQPYLGGAATETRFKAEGNQARFLHLATHALFEPFNGMYSGLVMAEEPQEDGYLEAREIVGMDLAADLVVLSACETARGQLSRGEGVIGLSWAFFVAGCPSTVVTQWKVADASTAQLMTAFYQHLKSGKGKAEALRQAQRQLLRSQQYAHPFYWSPFLLVGNWQ